MLAQPFLKLVVQQCTAFFMFQSNVARIATHIVHGLLLLVNGTTTVYYYRLTTIWWRMRIVHATKL